MKSGILSRIKQSIVTGGVEPRTVPLGLYRGLTLELDFSCQMQVWLGLWERETYSFIRKAARDCSWAIDIGAGKGELCVFLLKNTAARKILAFEPQGSEIEIFMRNLMLNKEYMNEKLSISSNFIGCAKQENYEPLDQLDLSLDEPGFIKIDVDGAELDVLNSGRNLLAKGSISILLETHSKKLEDDSVKLLESLDYQIRIIKNAWWRFIFPEYRPTPHNRWLWAWKR